MSTVLLCTVGGAHQPILQAIKAVDPDYVCFFCTEENKETGQVGSDTQVVGEGKVIKAKPSDDKATLPNIPTQAQLEDRFEYRVVPADSLDGAAAEMRSAIAVLLEKRPHDRFVADYTGGTKTMTAALVLAALDFDDVDLQVVTGSRPDLLRVAEGTQVATTAGVRALRLRRDMDQCLDGWRRFSYFEAAEELELIRPAADVPGAAALALATSLSRALARWDRFDHAGALELIGNFRPRVMARYPALVPTLELLTKDGSKREPARLFDLWLNAQRRAAQGRFDDAVARWYRLLEWTAQWQICVQLGLRTKDFPPDRLPGSVPAPAGGNESVNLGLVNAWKVVAACCTGPCRTFARKEGSTLRDHAERRNSSILAHGFKPVSQSDWEYLQDWTEDAFLPMLRKHAQQVGITKEIEQLPAEPPPV